MDNYIAVVFDTESQAFDGLHKLWKLDDHDELTIHAAAVVRRSDSGTFEIVTKHTNVGVRTAMGLGIGALMGALAGPIGVAAGIAGAATIVAGTAVGVGAAIGGAAGLTADAVKSGERDEAGFESSLVLPNGKAAVVAEVSEDRPMLIDAAMAVNGGNVFRRDKRAIREEFVGKDRYAHDLFRYDYNI